MPSRARSKNAAAAQPVIAISQSGKVTRLALKGGRQIVGGGAQCDVIVLGVSQEQAFAVEIYADKAKKRARMEALRQGVTLMKKDVAPGTSVPVAAGDVISFDGVDVWLEGVARAASSSARRYVAAGSLFSLSLILLVVGLATGNTHKTASDTYIVSSVASGTTPVPILLKEMSEALRISGLAVDIQYDEDMGQIDVGKEGQPLALAAKMQLSNLIESFARRSAVPLRDRTRLSSGVENLIASIALEPVRFVVGTDGKRYKEGDAIGGDWKIERISADVITVARGDQRDDLDIAPLTRSSGLKLAARQEGPVR